MSVGCGGGTRDEGQSKGGVLLFGNIFAFLAAPDYVHSAFTYFMFYYDFVLFSGQPGIGKTSSLAFLA